MLINQETIENSLNDVNIRLRAVMTEREKIYDKANVDLEKLVNSYQKSDKMDPNAVHFISELQSFLYAAQSANDARIKVLRQELLYVVSEIRKSIGDPEPILKMAYVVGTAINHPKAAQPKELFKSAKRAVREDLLGSIFGDRIGGAIGNAIDNRKRKIKEQRDFKVGVLSDRRGRLAQILDNVKLDRVEEEQPKEKKTRSKISSGGVVAPPPIAEQAIAPPPLVLGENQKLSKTGKTIMTKVVGEDGKETWKRSKNPDYKKEDNTSKNKVEAAVQRENSEEMLEFIKAQNELLEKIEVNTRGLSNSSKVEKQETDKPGLLSASIKDLSGIVTKLPGIISTSMDKFASLSRVLLGGRGFDKLSTGGKIARIGGNFAAGLTLANAAGNAVNAGTDDPSIARQAQKDPKDISLTDRAISGFGGAIAAMNPLTALAGATGHISQKEINEHIGAGVHSYFRDIGNIYGGARSAGMNPLFAGTTGLIGATMSEGNTFDKMKETISAPVKNIVDKTKNVVPTVVDKAKSAVDTITQIPKNIMSEVVNPKANPTTLTGKAATLIPAQARPVIERTIASMNPITSVREAINRMTGFTDEQKKNIGFIIEELQKKGMNPTQISAILGNVDKESKYRAVEENLNYSNTKNEHIRNVFGKERTGNLSDAQLDELKKDKVKFTEHMYGGTNTIGRGMLNTEPGDGWKYRGRGFIQITGKRNYMNASKAIYGDDRLVKDPDLVLRPQVAAQVTAWYTEEAGKNMAKRMSVDVSKASQAEMNRLYTAAIAGHKLDTSKPTNYDSILLDRVNKATNNPQLSEIVAKSGTRLSQGSTAMNRPPVTPPTVAPVMIDNSRTSVSNGGGGGPQGIPNVRNEESSFRRTNEKSAR